MALKYGITSNTFEPAAAESILESVEGMNSALADIALCQGKIEEVSQVMEGLQTALDTISTFGVGEESMGILNDDGSLGAVLGLQVPSIESLESMSEKSLESLDKKWESAIEGKLADAWEAVKKFFRELWGKITEYASRFWNWLKGLFTKNKTTAEADKKTTEAAKSVAPKAADAVVAASTAEEEQKAKADVKEEASKAADNAKQKVAAVVAKAPEPEQAAPASGGPSTPCQYKAAMDCVAQLPGHISTLRGIVAKTLGQIKSKKAVELFNDSSKSAFGILETGAQEAKKIHDKIAPIAAGLGFEVKVNMEEGKFPRTNYAPKELTGTNTQNGWKSVAEITQFMVSYAQGKFDVLSDSVVKQVSDQCLACIDKFEKEIDAAFDEPDEDGMGGSKEENAGVIASQKSKARVMFTQLSNSIIDTQKIAARLATKLQAQFNWCHRKASLIASATRAAIDAD